MATKSYFGSHAIIGTQLQSSTQFKIQYHTKIFQDNIINSPNIVLKIPLSAAEVIGYSTINQVAKN